jgi:cell division protein FtsB
MSIVRQIRKQAQSLVAPLIGLCLSGYFGYHLIEGDRGLTAWVRATEQFREKQRAADAVKAERERLQWRVSLLQSGNLDPDLLDEQSRKALNLVGHGEIVILNEDQPK